MAHVPFHTTRILRRAGLRADYLAVETSPVWDRCDFRAPSWRFSPLQALAEFVTFWRVVARYEIVHVHFALTLSIRGWELPLLRRLGRKVVIHNYRGCEARDPERNLRLHPETNICQECDYARAACSLPGVHPPPPRQRPAGPALRGAVQ